MNAYSCYICEKTFKNSRSLGTHNYKFHSSTTNTPRNPVHDKHATSVQSEYSPSAKTTSINGAVVRETLDELKTIMKSLKQRVDVQKEKVRELDSQMFRKKNSMK